MPLSTLVLTALTITWATPFSLHPENPRVFQFRGKATLLVTSGEHYGAVLNKDFNFVPYLDELESRGFNLTRTFSGTYHEVPGSFKIRDNTLAPKPGRYRSPWPLRDGKFDLDQIDPQYLTRLKSFLTEASKRGVIVEFVLFCPFYEDELWTVNPMNARNNSSGVGNCPREQVYTLKHPDLLRCQLEFVRRVVTELNPFDNLYYEICNEPYFGGVTLDWQRKISEAIVAAEKELPGKHLIAQNMANGSARVKTPDPNVSIFNFHYASPPDAVRENHGLRKPVGFDETGFKGTGDAVYRRQAWDFLMAGGAVFSNLDYSFTTEHPEGGARVTDPTPGGGGAELRRQLSVLKRFFDRVDLTHTVADHAFIHAEGKDNQHILGMADRQHDVFSLYVASGPTSSITLDLPPGPYRVEWIDTHTGAVLKSSDLVARRITEAENERATPRAGETSRGEHPRMGGTARVVIESPTYAEDIAVRVVARSPQTGKSRTRRESQ